MQSAYFSKFEYREPPHFPPLSPLRQAAWHFSAGLTIGFLALYLHWRWTASLNPEAMIFSVAVATAETLFALGTLLFFYDIWQEGDTPEAPATADITDIANAQPRPITRIDIFITTFDEGCEVVAPTLAAAQAVCCPTGCDLQIYLLDDGARPAMAKLAERYGARYLSRTSNIGFKAGNLRNGLFHSSGDFVVICDADTRLFPSFLDNTLGYFRDPRVAWVQTPHWFYDLPRGQTALEILLRIVPQCPRWLRKWAYHLTTGHRFAVDPFLSEPTVFFDLIQRRRNRNYASFCCGAASIHRREAIFETALLGQSRTNRQQARSLNINAAQLRHSSGLEPYRFHVSEDLYTSIELHSSPGRPRRSVYHPQPEAKMLSPQSAKALCTQRLKYAGGSIDLILRRNPIFRRGMPWRHRLHYAATFYAHLSVFWTPLLLMAPAYSLLTGQAPVVAYSASFFLHFLPMVFANELAMVLTSKGHSLTNGRCLSVSTLPLQLKAFWLVVRGHRPQFPPTPKTLSTAEDMRFLRANLMLALALCLIGLFGIWQFLMGSPNFRMSLLLVNLFWLTWNCTLLLQLPFAAWLHALGRSPAPPPARSSPQMKEATT